MLIPVFVLLLVYGFLGWSLVVFLVAGITDALDGLIARWTGQRTSLGAWLDPMADKLLLVTTFIVLTLPGVPLTNHIPLWLTVLVISRDVVIVAVVSIVSLAAGAADVQAVDAGETRDRHLHRHKRCDHVFQLPAGTVDHHRYRDLAVVDADRPVVSGLLHEAPEARQRVISLLK